jgi:hypothetical protein
MLSFRLLLLAFLVCSSASFKVYELGLFNVKPGNARSIGLQRKLAARIGRESNFKSHPKFCLSLCTKDVEGALSVNKKLTRSPIRRLWTFCIAPSLSSAAVLGIFVAIFLEQVDVKHQNTGIDHMLQIAEFASILHAFSGLLAFKSAMERGLENPLQIGIKGFISGFVVLADLPETNINSEKSSAA